MADNLDPNTLTPVPAAAAEAPAPQPAATEVTPAPAPVAVEQPTNTTPTSAPAEPAKPETVLGEALKEEPKTDSTTQPTSEVKPTEAKSEEVKPQEGQSEEPAPPPTYDPFALPEGMSLDTERVNKFTDILGEFEKDSKVDHALMQAFGQKAVDLYVEEATRLTQDITKYYQDAWNKQKAEWKDAFMTDIEIGGNRFQTTVDSARNFIRTHGGTPDQQTEFRALMETSGLGNHPAMIRLLANAGKALEEGKPLASVKPVPQQKSRIDTLYKGVKSA
jgi:hypothetical protein